jgi:hypothetical protein
MTGDKAGWAAAARETRKDTSDAVNQACDKIAAVSSSRSQLTS